MAHNVICAVCGARFDRDKIQAVRYGSRRYAHFDCCKDGELVPLEIAEEDTETVELNKLKDYIHALYGKYARWPVIMQQIKKYKEENNYTYSGMLKSLIYFHKVKGNDIDKETGGIGIIPFCYDDAFNYYYNMWSIQQKNEVRMMEDIRPKDIYVVIDNPEPVRKKKKLFTFLDEENE